MSGTHELAIHAEVDRAVDRFDWSKLSRRLATSTNPPDRTLDLSDRSLRVWPANVGFSHAIYFTVVQPPFL